MPCKSNELNDPSSVLCLHQHSLPRLGAVGSQGGSGRLGGDTEETRIVEALNAPEGLPDSCTSYVRLLGFIVMVSAP